MRKWTIYCTKCVKYEQNVLSVLPNADSLLSSSTAATADMLAGAELKSVRGNSK